MKKKVIVEIKNFLIQELSELAHSADQTESAQRIAEIQRLLVQYQFLPVREYNDEDVICPAALVELELAQSRTFCFIVPQGGGLVMQVDGKPVQVVTPYSPLGEALLGKKVGQVVEVQMPGRPARVYRVVSLS